MDDAQLMFLAASTHYPPKPGKEGPAHLVVRWTKSYSGNSHRDFSTSYCGEKVTEKDDWYYSVTQSYFDYVMGRYGICQRCWIAWNAADPAIKSYPEPRHDPLRHYSGHFLEDSMF